MKVKQFPVLIKTLGIPLVCLAFPAIQLATLHSTSTVRIKVIPLLAICLWFIWYWIYLSRNRLRQRFAKLRKPSQRLSATLLIAYTFFAMIVSRMWWGNW